MKSEIDRIMMLDLETGTYIQHRIFFRTLQFLGYVTRKRVVDLRDGKFALVMGRGGVCGTLTFEEWVNYHRKTAPTKEEDLYNLRTTL